MVNGASMVVRIADNRASHVSLVTPDSLDDVALL
jgi:hypothetical protein